MGEFSLVIGKMDDDAGLWDRLRSSGYPVRGKTFGAGRFWFCDFRSLGTLKEVNLLVQESSVISEVWPVAPICILMASFL